MFTVKTLINFVLSFFLGMIALQSFSNAFAAEETPLYLLAGALGQRDFLSEVKGPAIATTLTLQGGDMMEWETTLTGDITGKQYRVSLILKSLGVAKLEIEILVVPDNAHANNELAIAATTIEVNDRRAIMLDNQREFARFEKAFDGIDPKTKAGDTLILRIRNRREGEATLVFGGQISDSHIVIPPVTSPAVKPLRGDWKGKTNQNEDVTFTVQKLGDPYLIDNFKVNAFVHCEQDGDKAPARDIFHGEPNVIKLNHENSFRFVTRDSFFVRGTFVNPQTAFGVWSLSAFENPVFCSEQGTWTAEGTLSVTPQGKLATTWGNMKTQ